MRFRLLLISLLFTVTALAQAASLRLGTLDVTPYGYLGADKQADGAFYQLTNRVAERAGLPYQNTLYPTARLYAMLQRRQIDLAISSLKLDEQMGLIKLGTISQLEGVILYRAQLPLKPRQLEEFKPYLIGRLNGTCPLLQRKGHRLYEVSDYRQAMRMLVAGRLDGLCGELGGLSPALNAEPAVQPLLAPPFVFLTTDVFLYANPKLPATTLQQLSRATAALNSEGEPQRILKRYVASPLRQRSPMEPTP
ncbi:substrate-binding periplasmic protein [Chitinimonas sp. JJ19]|uniref:substrate-binding periplasmic protein n=1 Tax=Chitinimonas sp. JJ19 TaxID=3109352 RepID=UPI002FFE9952